MTLSSGEIPISFILKKGLFYIYRKIYMHISLTGRKDKTELR